MKYKSRRRVQQDMLKAGVESKHARKLARLVGLAGQRAKNKIKVIFLFVSMDSSEAKKHYIV